MRPNEINGGQRYENAVIIQRVDQLVAGYLQRMGYEQAAASLSRESPFLPDPSAGGVFINDRLHDQTLEEIVRQISETGGFGIHQTMLEFGIELRNLASRFTDATARLSGQPGRSLPAQLFGRTSRSRGNSMQNQQGRSPSLTARSAMELRRISQIGERRYAEQQSLAAAPAPPVAMISTAPLVPVTHPETCDVHETPASSQESSETTSSRRKPQQPQQWSSMINHGLVEPIVGYMNARPLDTGNNIELEPEFIDELDYIITALDYDPGKDGQQQNMDGFEPAFEQMMHNGEEHFQASSLPIDGEEVVESESMPHGNSYHQFPVPSPLLSPLPRDVSFRKHSETAEDASAVGAEREIETPPLKMSTNQPKASTPRSDDTRHLDHKHHNSYHREKREEHLKSFTIPKTSRSSPSRHRCDEKKRHKEKEKREEREKRDREHDKRRDRDRRPSTRATSSSLQSDRESTFDRSINESEPKKKKDRKDRDAEKERESEKEKQKRRNEKHSQQPAYSSSSLQKDGDDRSHRKERSHGGSDQKLDIMRKRKADEMNKMDFSFKIPKKSGSVKEFTPSQSGPLIRESLPSSSSIKSEKLEKLEKSEKTRKQSHDLSHGEDAPDRTRFLQPRTHIARLTSMLVNADQLYEKFRKGKEKRNEAQNDAYGEDEVPEEVVKPARNKYSYAPKKGYMSAKKAPNKTSPSTEESSADEHDTEKETASEDEDEFARKSRRDETPSPDPPEKRRKKNYEYMIDKTEHWDSVLDRVHKK